MLTKKYPIVRITSDNIEKLEDEVVAEGAVQINLNDTELATLLCSPYEERELGTGFLFTEGFIDSADDILGFEQKGQSLYFTIDPERFSKETSVQRYITSGCGRGASFELARKSLKLKNKEKGKSLKVSAEQIFKLMSNFQKRSEVFKSTGGVHSAAICSVSELLFFSEDIGRHNAVDRVIGSLILKRIPLHDKLLLSSGRISSEIARKVAFADIPIFVSRSAPTDMALKIAAELGLTVAGFARGSRMNVYTHGDRIKA
ncbi:MAG: formate dehydrogenase accessory sulfurtransferase FdhD [Pseudomonadota bacterium]